jgi:NTE family protein
MTCFGRALIIAALILPIGSPSISAPQTSEKRKTVGLALSGGGALGIAHVGVLRYMEEHRVPIDLIAGTSMGGLLGGLYATGHDADALAQIVKTADWDDLLRSTPRYEDRSVSEKLEWNRITGAYSIPLRTGFALPVGINSAEPLVLLLSGQTAAYWDVDDFDELPIPFRCVATDLQSGQAFILGEGRLPEALRATMAIPGIFTPVEWNNRLLADGGLVNNLPTDVAKSMGAGVIIGVTLRLPVPNAHELETLPSVLRQTMNISVLQNENRNLPIADIPITVQLATRSLMDFRNAQALMDAGYQAAAANQAALDKLALSPQEWEEHLRNRKARERTLPPAGKLVGVTAPHPGIQKNAASELARKTGDMVSRARLETALSGLTAATGLPNSFYGWHTEPGRIGYQVKLETRRVNEVVLRPSLFYQLSDGEPSRAAVRVTGTAVRKDAYKSRFLGGISIGSNPAANLEYYHPFGGSPYFIAPGLALERAHFSQYIGDDRADSTRTRFSGSLYFGMGTWRRVQLRVGARAGVDRYNNPVPVGSIETSDTGFANPEVVGIINTQDSGGLPSSGTRVNASAGYSFRERPFPYLEMNFDHFQPVGKQFSAFAIGRTDTSMGKRLGFYDQFTAGGLTQLDAYRYQEIRGDTVLVAGGGILYRGMNPNQASFRPILGSWYEAASVDWRTSRSDFKQSATVGVFAPTPLGIAGLTFSMDLKGSTRFRLSLGSFWNRP